MSQKASKDELALREFHSITLANNLSFVEKASRLLEQGCQYLGLRCGIISYVEGDRYTVLHVYTNSDQYNILSGDVFDFGTAYCKFTIEQRKPVGFHHAAITEIASHPSYEALKLEAYLGAPTFLNDEIFGTVNFTSIEPREHEFSDSEKYYVQLVAEWFSSQLDKHYQKQSVLESYQDIASRLQHLPHAIIEFSQDYKVLNWSDSATDMFGWDRSQVIHKKPNEWTGVDEEDLAELMLSLNRINKSEGDGYAFHWNLIKNSGDSISTEWFLSYIEGENKQSTIIRAHILDITERVKIENELLRKNARYLDLYENAPDMYLSLDQAGNIISANKLCYQTLGYSETVLLGKPYWNFILKNDIRRIRRLIDVAFMGDVDELEMEASLLTSANSVVKTHQKIRIIQAKKGMPRELRIIARDITERKRGQAQRMQHLQKQRDELSHELQHRIKNSLQAVIGLLTMNIDASPELKPLLTNSISQINTISVVNGLILDGKEDVEIGRLLDSLQEASCRLFNYNIQFEQICNTNSKIMLKGEEIIPVSLIYSELLMNAFKYHSENTMGENYINVTVTLNEQNVEIIIKNSCNYLKFRGVESTQMGHSMIQTLIPPQGASIKFIKKDEYFEVRLLLMDPAVIYEVIC